MSELIEAVLIEAMSKAYSEVGQWTTPEHMPPALRKAIMTAITDAGYRIVPGWQPIETAPRDGTNVLAFWSDWGDCGVVRFDRGEWWAMMHDVVTPTHWMPLPAPPGDEK